MDRAQENKSNNPQPRQRISFASLKRYVVLFFKDILAIEGVDYQATIEGVKEDMVFRGHKAWILVFSILIASIGLNENSTAVIIGAMLISPLMGPIVAIGLSIGTYDFETFKRGLKNLLIAVTISLVASTLYFWLTPIKEAHSELLARIRPTFLDVMIALFGGFAGIIAEARQEKSNVIPGVAIATALMPPLCTAGYGLGTGQMRFFLGAMYLFFINSVFISIATYLMVKYLRFPHKKFVDQAREKRIKRWITAFALIVIIPSTVIFLNVIKESRFGSLATQFVQKEVLLDSTQLISKNFVFTDTVSYIDLYFIGKPVSERQIRQWDKKLEFYNFSARGNWLKRLVMPDSVAIRVFQARDNSQLMQQKFASMDQLLRQQIKSDLLEELYRKNEQLLADKDKRIAFLEQQLMRFKADSIPVIGLFGELKVNYPRIKHVAFARSVYCLNDTLLDTIPVLIVRWKPRTNYYYKRASERKIAQWLKIRLGIDTAMVLEQR